MKLSSSYPIIENKQQLTEDWSIVLEGKFKKRFEDTSIVIWQPGLTFG
jgi:hypothetical protein